MPFNEHLHTPFGDPWWTWF